MKKSQVDSSSGRLLQVDEGVGEQVVVREYDEEGNVNNETTRPFRQDEIALERAANNHRAARDELPSLLNRPLNGADILQLLLAIGMISPDQVTQILEENE